MIKRISALLLLCLLLSCFLVTPIMALDLGFLEDVDVFETIGGILGNDSEKSLPKLKRFKGNYYAKTDLEGFSAALSRIETAKTVKVNDDDTISFGDYRLKQIDRGLFVEADWEESAEGVPFMMAFSLDEDERVTEILTSEGEKYLPAAFYEGPFVTMLCYYLLIGFAVWFFFSGPIAILRWLRWHKEHGTGEGFRFVLPNLFAMFISVLILFQVPLVTDFLGIGQGLRNFTPIPLLLCGIGALYGYVLAFVTSLTHRKIFHREVRTAFLFVAYVFLICYWGIVPL